MLKSNPVGALLALTSLFTALLAATLIFSYTQQARTNQRLQMELAVISRNQAGLQSLLTEVVEHGKQDPSIEQLLASVGIRQQTNANAAKPGGR